MGIGKWIGGVLGFMAFGPLGALAGIILGSFFEEEANMTGQPFGGRTNYDDQYTRRDPYAGERNSNGLLYHPCRWENHAQRDGICPSIPPKELRRDRRRPR